MKLLKYRLLPMLVGGLILCAPLTSFASETVQTTANVNFREQPSTEAGVIQLLQVGSRIELLAEEDGWSKVMVDQQTGFIKSDYISTQLEETYIPSGEGQNRTNVTALAASVELPSWTEAKEIFTVGQTATVYDVETGKTYYVRSFSNGNHADVEPVTKEDTAILKQTYGGVWKWDPRPVWVTINGHTMAASINGMPHGGGVNHGNGMDGQVCIHFKGSTTHNGNESFAEWHQEVLMDAYQLALQLR